MTAFSAIRGQFGPKFELARDFMVAFFTCKNEKDPVKNESATVLTRLYVVFSDAEGQLTLKSVVEFC